jgi:hypothetical protein
MLTAIITLQPTTADLTGLRDMLAEAAALGVPGATALIDGGHIHVEGEDDAPLGSLGNDLDALIAFTQARADLPGETVVVYGADLALDLPVLSVARIGCGEHIGSLPDNVIVTVNPACTDCTD